MNLSSIENIIHHKSSKMNKDEYHKNLIEEIRKCVINNIHIKVNMSELIYLININYEINKILFPNYIIQLINDNHLDKYLILNKITE